MSTFYYFVYETMIMSEIEILNLPITQEEAEVSAKLQLTQYPSKYIPKDECGTYFSSELCALGAIWGTMEVSSGNLISVYIKEQFTSQDVAPFIIGWGFAFLFHQRGYTIFHCSALQMHGKGIMISGVSGAGKSTTALSLIKSGAKYLADDMAIIHPTSNYELIPAYPVQKVCADVSLHLKKEKLLHINEGRDKFAYHNESEYENKPIKATHLILLNIHDEKELVVKEHQGIQKWMRVLECMYLNELFATFGTPEKDKINCLKFVETMKVLEITRPRDGNTLENITKVIQEFVSA